MQIRQVSVRQLRIDGYLEAKRRADDPTRYKVVFFKRRTLAEQRGYTPSYDDTMFHAPVTWCVIDVETQVIV